MRTLNFGPFQLDPVKRNITDVTGAVVGLTSREFDILQLLAANAGKVVPRESFDSYVWKDQTVLESTLTTHISSLRRKLGRAHAGAENYIRTIQGRGYQLCEQVTYVEESSSSSCSESSSADGGCDPEQPPRDVKALSSSSSSELVAESANQMRCGTCGPHVSEGSAPMGGGVRPASWGSAFKRVQKVGATLALVLLILIVVSAFEPTRLEITSFRRLTFDGRAKEGPLAFDGRFVYFRLAMTPNQVHRRVNVSDLKLESLNSLTNETQVDGYCLAGNSLLVFTLEDRALALHTGSRSVRNVILANPSLLSGALSPNCKQLAFTGIGYIGTQNMESRAKSRTFSVPGHATYPYWRPDGRLIRFCLSNPVTNKLVLWQVRPGSSKPVPVKDAPEGVCAGAWTRDGRLFVAASVSSVAQGELWTFEDSLLRGTVVRKIDAGPRTWRWPVSDSATNRLFAIGATNRFELSELNPYTGAIQPYFGGISATEINFSSDRRNGVFTKYPEWQIWVTNADGSNSQQILGDFSEGHGAHFSPDRRRIAFMGKRGSTWRVFVAETAGGRATIPFDSGPDQGVPSWRSNHQLVFGDRLHYDGRDRDMRIHVLDTATDPPRVSDLPNSRGFWTPRMSRDGQRLVALGYDSKSLAEYDFASNGWRVVGRARFFDSPEWVGPDCIFTYGVDLSGAGVVFRALPSKTQLQVLTRFDPSQMAPFSSVDSTPDGKILLLRRIEIDDVYELTYKNR